MKYVILIHSNPQPWGHPTGELRRRGARPAAGGARCRRRLRSTRCSRSSRRAASSRAARRSATPRRPGCTAGTASGTVATDGPYAESKEHLAGFFLLDVASQERAEELAGYFAGPGDTVELRPAYVWEE